MLSTLSLDFYLSPAKSGRIVSETAVASEIITVVILLGLAEKIV